MAVEDTVPADPRRSRRDNESAWAISIETTKRNIVMIQSLIGLSVAIFTFLLFFLYPRLVSGEVNPILFRLTVGTVVLSLFVFIYSGTFYYYCLHNLGNDDERARAYLRRGDRCAVTALALFVLAPALVLFTVNLPDLASVALVLWVGYILLSVVGARRPSGRIRS